MPRPEAGYIPLTPGSKARFQRRALVGVGVFVLLSLGLHFTMGPTMTTIAPLWRTPDVADQGVSIITLSRAKLVYVKPTPTPSPPPRIYLRTIANLAPMKYLEFGSRGRRHAIKPPSRRTALLSVHTGVEPSPAPGPDAAAATNQIPATKPKTGDSAQADTGASKANVSGAVVWGDDNPPRVLSLAALTGASPSGQNSTAGAPDSRHVRLEVEVGPDGNVLSVKIITSSGDPTIDNAAVEAARKSTYAPATLNGLPVHGTCVLDFPVFAVSTT